MQNSRIQQKTRITIPYQGYRWTVRTTCLTCSRSFFPFLLFHFINFFFLFFHLSLGNFCYILQFSFPQLIPRDTCHLPSPTRSTLSNNTRTNEKKKNSPSVLFFVFLFPFLQRGECNLFL